LDKANIWKAAIDIHDQINPFQQKLEREQQPLASTALITKKQAQYNAKFD
jgi:hypothetical protein